MSFDEKLSQFWFCKKDGSKLREYIPMKVAGTPYFSISKRSIETSLQNAVAVKKLTEDMVAEAKELALLMFEMDPTLTRVTLVSTKCPLCDKKYISPKLHQIYTPKDKRKRLTSNVRKLTAEAEKKLLQQSTVQDNSLWNKIVRLWWLWFLASFLLGIIAIILQQLDVVRDFLPKLLRILLK